jgi:ABC-type transport system involved in multi-copper enzyme maturation permease subunit
MKEVKAREAEAMGLQEGPAPAAGAAGLAGPSLAPSAWRAWLALVWLSFWRQMRVGQLVWIALGLLAFAVALVSIQTNLRGWNMARWRRSGWTYTQHVSALYAANTLTHRTIGGQSVQHALLGSCLLIISPDAADESGQVLSLSGFQVFSQWFVFSLFLTFLLPFWSLSFATEALGGERESQSLIWLLSRPLPRPAIYLGKFVALLPWALGLNVGGFALVCLMAGPPGRMALALYWPAVFWATMTFTSLFLLVGAYFRRPAVVAIVYSFCLEVVLGNMPGYLKRVSIGFYARSLMFAEAETIGRELDRPSVFLPVDGPVALRVLIGTMVVLLVVGMWLFSRTQYHEVD